MAASGMYWREAATLMLVAPSAARRKSPERPADPDYKILLLKRSAKSRFQPNVIVFPGGATDDHDFVDAWKGIFERVTGAPFRDTVRRLEIAGARLPQFARNRTSSAIPAEVAFRITAIREAFEESGVLLVLSASDFKKRNLSVVERDKPTALSRVSNPGWWRRRIRKDAKQFLVMCQQLNVVPNVWALTEWCNWLTPPLRQVSKPPPKPHRFDTVFFLCCLAEMPRASADEQETTDSQWVSPRSILQTFYRDHPKIDLHPPQMYELSRLCRLPRMSHLCLFAHGREKEGLERTFPVVFMCSDGLLVLYPGDDLYPESLDLEGKDPRIALAQTVEEVGGHSQNLNRIERMFNTGSAPRLRCNVRIHGHYTPINTDQMLAASTARL